VKSAVVKRRADNVVNFSDPPSKFICKIHKCDSESIN
jgi:hypothetical protein